VRSAGILGTGLIGASLGLALRADGWHVTGWDPDEQVGATVLERGAIDVLAESEAAATAGDLDLLVLSGPPAAIADFVARREVPFLTIDTAGAKSAIVAASTLAHFVPTHPMTGREVSGPEAATASLFSGATWVIVADGAAEADLAAVESIVAALGARPVRMSAAAHDSAVATISHLPQLLAASLVTVAGRHPEALNLAAGSFRDLTRVAGSDPAIWLEVLAANREKVLEAVAELLDDLGHLSELLRSGDLDELREALDLSRETRRTLAARATAVRVALADRPGELAKVGMAMSAAKADVRDIQLRHAPYGGGGVLTISVRPGDAAALRDAITAAGLVLAR